MIGRMLAHYHVLEFCGAGGMGIVYRARDTHLERDIAIKVLPTGALADERARIRFRHEALALSKLNHPRICAVYDFDVDEGIDFLVLEFVPGVTLSERLKQGPIPEDQLLVLANEVGEALEAAHEQGIVHRDLKPGNIMLTPSGRTKVLDFGLAKQLRAEAGPSSWTTVTEPHGVAGTLPYMAPEQLLGLPTDARTDVYALGAVLYEAATGRPPFQESTPIALTDSILNRSLHTVASQTPVSARLESVILRCLEKNPDDRFPSARAFRDALVSPAPAMKHASSQSVPSFRHRWLGGLMPVLAAAGTALVLLLALDVGSLRERLAGIVGSPKGRIHALAVLPLANLSRDPEEEFFADGMTDELITSLSQIRELRVISRTSAMRYKGTRKALREIARELDVDAILEGSVVRSDGLVRVSASLVEVATDRSLWATRYERQLANVLALQNEIASTIADQVRVQLEPEVKARLARARDVEPGVYESYLRGRFHLGKFSMEGFHQAARMFQRAIDMDPNYAPAYAGLALSYLSLSSVELDPKNAMRLARIAAGRALELDPGLAEAHTVLAGVKAFYEYDWRAGEAGFRRAIELNPSDVTAHQNYAYLLLVNRRFFEAKAELEKALEIDPLSDQVATMSVWPLRLGRECNKTIAAAERLLARKPELTAARLILAQCLLDKRESARGLSEMKRVYDEEPVPLVQGWLGYAHARAGDRTSAERILRNLQARSKNEFVQPYSFAILYMGLEDHQSAIDWLEKGVETHSEEVIFSATEPIFDPLRGQPRFEALLRRLGLPTN